MHLLPGRVKSMVEGCIAENSVIPCHKTLDQERSVCRGLWDVHYHDIQVLQLADRMGVVAYNDLPPE